MSEEGFTASRDHEPSIGSSVQWQPIETAPRDGTEVRVVKAGRFPLFLYPIRSRFQGGKWLAYFGEGDWRSYDPQPTHWMSPE